MAKGEAWMVEANYSAPSPVSTLAVTFPTLQNLTFSAQRSPEYFE